MLSVHTNTTIEARISGICTAGLVGLLSTWAGAHSCGLQCHRYKTHSPTIHHCGCVPHIQNISASTGPGTLWVWTLIHLDLEYADMQERLELCRERKDRANRTFDRLKWNWWTRGYYWPLPQRLSTDGCKCVSLSVSEKNQFSSLQQWTSSHILLNSSRVKTHVLLVHVLYQHVFKTADHWKFWTTFKVMQLQAYD